MANSNGAPTAATPSDVSSKEDRRQQTRDFIKAGFENKTKGETLFNQIVYGGLGFGFVTGVSIFATWLLRDSKILSGHYTNLIKKVQNTFKGNRSGAALDTFNNSVNSAMTIGALFTGGTIATVLPVKAMEDNKASIVKALDKKIYGADEVATNPDIIAAHHELDTAPKQSWASVFVSRVVAFTLTISTWYLVGAQNSPLVQSFKDARNPLKNKSLDSIAINLGRKVEGKLYPERKPLIEAAHRAVPNDVSRSQSAPDGMVSRLISYITQDSIYTLITSTSLYISTRIFGPIFSKSHTNAASEKISTATEKLPHPTENSASLPIKPSENQKTSDSASLHDSQDSALSTEQPLPKVSAVAHNAMLHAPEPPALAQGA